MIVVGCLGVGLVGSVVLMMCECDDEKKRKVGGWEVLGFKY